MNKPYPQVQLAELLTLHTDYIDAPEPKLYPKLSVRLYGKGVISDAPADGSTLRMKRHQIAKVGQVILSEIWGKRGAIGFVPPEGEGALCTSHFFLFNVRRERVAPGYLQAIFTANYLEGQLGSEAKGTTGYAAVRPKHLLAARIPLPSLDEQRRIVSRIEELAARIGEGQKLRAESIEDSSSVIISMHVSLGGERLRSLRDILKLDERRVPIRPNGTYPQVGIKGFGGGLFARGAVDGTQTTYKEFNQLFDGALVLSQVKGWEGAVAVCGERYAGWYASPEYRTFSFTSTEALPEYMSPIVSSPWFYTKLADLTRGVGARRERTRPEAFLEMQLPMPTVEQQHSALQVFEKLDALKEMQSETSAELDALMPSILSKAFRGEL